MITFVLINFFLSIYDVYFSFVMKKGYRAEKFFKYHRFAWLKKLRSTALGDEILIGYKQIKS